MKDNETALQTKDVENLKLTKHIETLDANELNLEIKFESQISELKKVIDNLKQNELQSKFYWKEFVTIEFQCATCDWSETWCPTHFFQTKYGNIGLKRKSDEKNENPERKRQRIY